jgi:hypothetical protein
MASMRELETELRNIRLNIRGAMKATGDVDAKTVEAQAVLLKAWTSKFETLYIKKSDQKPAKRLDILDKGKKLTEDGWLCYEVMLDVSLDAIGPAPGLAKWEDRPGGVVFGDSKAQLLTILNDLLINFTEYRRYTLEE